MRLEPPADHEKPPCPYVAGLKLVVEPHTPYPPFGGVYRGSGPKEYECYADIKDHTHTRYCVRDLKPDDGRTSPPPSDSSDSEASLMIDSVIRGGDEAGAQIVVFHWDKDPDQTKYVAKIFDPLYYKYKDTEHGLPTDVVWIAARDYSIEAAAYEELTNYERAHETDSENITGAYPEYFGSWSFDLKLVLDGATYTRTIPMIAMEYLDGSTMQEVIDDDQVPISDDIRIQTFICAVKANLKLKMAGVLQGDFAPRNIFFVGEIESPSLGAVIFDFNVAKVLSRMSPPRSPPKIDPVAAVTDSGSQIFFQHWLPAWFYEDEEKRKSEVMRLRHRDEDEDEDPGLGALVAHKRTTAQRSTRTFQSLQPASLASASTLSEGGTNNLELLAFKPKSVLLLFFMKHDNKKMALPTTLMSRYVKVAAVFALLFLFLYSKQSFHTTSSDDKICGPHGWKPFHSAPGQPPRKVYDLTMINTELDWLEIRMNSTWDEVDYFIVVESSKTFTSLPKTLHLKTALSDPDSPIHKYKSKLIYHEITFSESFKPKKAWDMEEFQRNTMLTQVFPLLTKPEQQPRLDDIILVSDMDEIPRPSTLSLLKNCQFPRRLTLNSRFYYYSFQYLHVGPEWAHPQATYYTGSNTLLPNDLRMGDGPFWRKYFEMGTLGNAAWHCSSCFATLNEMLTKMKSFSHVEFNQEDHRDKDRIVDRVGKGKDLWDRKGEEYTRVEKNEDVPDFLKREGERKRFGYMLDRDGEGAGFRDWKKE
ncbi:glycosyltransferase family 17-domain-containing protein [Triangularia verruculosa]|uniref:Glycosyltransferase family 17-domain-containing protein n=1 Tax=Triangularia verruculosa TaxID=2587418 RepID=A0AAN7B0E9_9PEZI|nr:glycosyltransferase family 17-domain-containing protein [Triangularia verruculosa]